MARKFKYTVNIEELKLDEDATELFLKDNQKTVFENMLHQGINSRFSTGIGGKTQRTFGRILDKLDKTETDYLELEDSEFNFLKDLFNNEATKFASQNTRLINRYRDALKAKPEEDTESDDGESESSEE